ncbi:MAG: site-2 protease family protein [Planctomycetia bacterium]|nr:site-2 protease family protein [Planctomycetia bacterium]
MFLSAPQPTPADLQFVVSGIPVRVSAWFWVAAALLGWGVCQSTAGGDQREIVRYLLVWVGVVFVSLLVHEMGHALAYRACGQSAHIVLYHFGGLAIPETWGGRGVRKPFGRLLVSAAGPLAQLGLAAAIVAILKVGGYRVPFPIESVGNWLGLSAGRPLPSQLVIAMIWFLLQVNVFWPLLNLIPVPPLDGGQIVREGLLSLRVNDAERIAGIIGVVVGAAVAYWAYSHQEMYLGIMFAMLAVSCYQNLSGGASWKRWN